MSWSNFGLDSLGDYTNLDEEHIKKWGRELDKNVWQPVAGWFGKDKGSSKPKTPLVDENGNSIDATVAGMLKLLLSSQINADKAVSTLATKGATSLDLAAVLKPLQEQADQLDGTTNPLASLSSALAKSAIGNTAAAGMSAVSAARLSGDGRFGSGGAAAVLASRAATDAAVGQSSAIAQALVQGKLGEANFQQSKQAQQIEVSKTIAQLLQTQADLKENRARLAIAQQNNNQNVYANFAQIFGGRDQAKINQTTAKDVAWISAAGQALANNSNSASSGF